MIFQARHIISPCATRGTSDREDCLSEGAVVWKRYLGVGLL
jgi:hypothetical protein